MHWTNLSINKMCYALFIFAKWLQSLPYCFIRAKNKALQFKAFEVKKKKNQPEKISQEQQIEKKKKLIKVNVKWKLNQGSRLH